MIWNAVSTRGSSSRNSAHVRTCCANRRKAMSDLIERLNDAWRKLYGDGDEHDVCDTIAEAAAALARAREDAERLDWLASEAQPLWGSRDRGGYELPYFAITSGRECCDPGDLRAAIDQARGKENGNG